MKKSNIIEKKDDTPIPHKFINENINVINYKQENIEDFNKNNNENINENIYENIDHDYDDEYYNNNEDIRYYNNSQARENLDNLAKIMFR